METHIGFPKKSKKNDSENSLSKFVFPNFDSEFSLSKIFDSENSLSKIVFQSFDSEFSLSKIIDSENSLSKNFDSENSLSKFISPNFDSEFSLSKIVLFSCLKVRHVSPTVPLMMHEHADLAVCCVRHAYPAAYMCVAILAIAP